MKKFYKVYLSDNTPFHIFSSIAILLIIASWFVPPVSYIDASVLTAVGEIFAFAALWTVIKAIDQGTDATITKGDITLTIDNKEKNEQDS